MGDKGDGGADREAGEKAHFSLPRSKRSDRGEKGWKSVKRRMAKDVVEYNGVYLGFR